MAIARGSSVDLKWQSFIPVYYGFTTTYKLEVATMEEGVLSAYSTIATGISASEFTVSDLVLGTTYYYAVTPEGITGPGTRSINSAPYTVMGIFFNYILLIYFTYFFEKRIATCSYKSCFWSNCDACIW